MTKRVVKDKGFADSTHVVAAPGIKRSISVRAAWTQAVDDKRNEAFTGQRWLETANASLLIYNRPPACSTPDFFHKSKSGVLHIIFDR
jgi:hypothetical protein